MTTNREVAKIMGVMVHAYPRYELSGDSIKLYGQLLADIPVDVLGASAQQIMVESKFFPSIAEWRDKALDIMHGTHNLPNAAEAWENAMEQVRKCGDYYHYQLVVHTPEYLHPVVEHAVNVIGYRNLLMSENIMADRSHFFKVYEQLLSRAQNDQKLLPEVRAVSAKYAMGVGDLVEKLGSGDCVKVREEVET